MKKDYYRYMKPVKTEKKGEKSVKKPGKVMSNREQGDTDLKKDL